MQLPYYDVKIHRSHGVRTQIFQFRVRRNGSNPVVDVKFLLYYKADSEKKSRFGIYRASYSMKESVYYFSIYLLWAPSKAQKKGTSLKK